MANTNSSQSYSLSVLDFVDYYYCISRGCSTTSSSGKYKEINVFIRFVKLIWTNEDFQTFLFATMAFLNLFPFQFLTRYEYRIQILFFLFSNLSPCI